MEESGAAREFIVISTLTLTHLLLLTQLVALVASAVGVYWRLREMMLRLHNENKEMIMRVGAHASTVEAKIDPIVQWWNRRQERRDDLRDDPH